MNPIDNHAFFLTNQNPPIPPNDRISLHLSPPPSPIPQNKKRVWSSTACELTCSSGDSAAGYKIHLGFSGAAPAGSDVERCISPLTENVGVVRCCRDSCESTRCDYGKCPEPEPLYTPASSSQACTADADGNVANGLCECESVSKRSLCVILQWSIY